MDTAKDVEKISDEEAARDEDALLTYEEHGGLDPKEQTVKEGH